MLADVAVVAMAYLMGSFSFGLFVAQWHGEADLRGSGSGNIGATNVARTVGRMAALITLSGDSAKGCAAVLLAQWAGNSLTASALAALAAVLGHMFPVYYRFRGGKGVATSLGVMTPLLPWPTLGGVIIWVAVALVLRYVFGGVHACSPRGALAGLAAGRSITAGTGCCCCCVPDCRRPPNQPAAPRARNGISALVILAAGFGL